MNHSGPLLLAAILSVVNLCRVSCVYIEKNAYKGISISFSESLHEDLLKFEKIKQILTRSSDLLYHATRKRSYFGEFVLTVPTSWKGDMCRELEQSNKPVSTVDIHLHDWPGKTELTTKHSRGCGEQGDIIYMPQQWLDGDVEDHARQFVKQWSIYRYGVFEEDPIKDGSCYRTKDAWSPVGCYNVKTDSEAAFENGVPSCHLPTEFFKDKELKSSLMSQSNSSEILNFCDGSESYPHNPAMPTLHNNLCKGDTVWSVIEKSEDFKDSRNLSLKADKPPSTPVFKCFKEPQLQVTFAIQNSTTSAIINLAAEIVGLRYALYQFLKNAVPSETKANVVMFSDEADNSQFVDLDLKNPKALEDAITKHVKTFKSVKETCLVCGFQKALKASLAQNHPSPIVIIIARESSLSGAKPSQLTESIRNFLPSKRLYLILVEDTNDEVLPSMVVEAVRSTGGNIYSMPNETVFMSSRLQVILSGVVKNHLQVEDSIVVVHESNYDNIAESFTDSFTTPNNIIAEKLVYNMFCDPAGDVQELNSNCTYEKTASATFKCGEVTDFTHQEVSTRTWKYPFEYQGGPTPPKCSSVALLIPSPSTKKPYTLKGWLSKYQIHVGRDTLVIYAEIAGSSDQAMVVTATVSSSTFPAPVTIKLLDNGNGDPDVKPGDGIYSRYFSSFTKKGTYVVSISAEILYENDKLLAMEDNKRNVARIVQRKIIGSFSVNEDFPDVDIFPPNRIADLTVVAIDHENATVTLQWTAPGNDYDFETAFAYEIKYSEQPASLSELYFNQEQSLALPKNSSIPSGSGTTERMEFHFPEISTGSTYYIALRAIDAENNRGKVSNIVQVQFNRSENIITEAFSTSTGMSSLGSTVPTVSPENENHTRDETNATAETTTANPENTTIIILENNNIFDTKFIIVLSSAGGILLIIIIVNILIYYCCIKKRRKDHPEAKESSKKTSLRPPYNMNIAYQDDTASSNNGAAASDGNTYAEPVDRSSTLQQRYTHYTSQQIKENRRTSKELGFKLVEVHPHTTSSLSRRLNNLGSGTDTRPSVAEPQQPSSLGDDARVYPLGVV